MKTLRILSLLLMVIASTFTFSNAATTKSSKRLILKEKEKWDNQNQKKPPFNPITVDLTTDKCIEVQFFGNEDSPSTFQIKDKLGNLIFQDTIHATSEEIYQIDLHEFQSGEYTLIYTDNYVEMIGEFEIE